MTTANIATIGAVLNAVAGFSAVDRVNAFEGGRGLAMQVAVTHPKGACNEDEKAEITDAVQGVAAFDVKCIAHDTYYVLSATLKGSTGKVKGADLSVKELEALLAKKQAELEQ